MMNDAGGICCWEGRAASLVEGGGLFLVGGSMDWGVQRGCVGMNRPHGAMQEGYLLLSFVVNKYYPSASRKISCET